MKSAAIETAERNVAFVANHLARKGGTGIARYARELVNAFHSLDTPFRVVPVATWSEMEKKDLRTLKERTGLRILPTGRWLTPLLWATVGAPKLEDLVDFPVDIVHANYLGHMVATRKPFVVTVHDLGPLTHPQFFPRDSRWFIERALRFAVRHADAFVCVSQATADDLVVYTRRNYGVDVSKRTFVVHEGVSETFFRPPENMSALWNEMASQVPEPFILSVGKISPRKNLGVVLRAMKKLEVRIPHHLVVVGGTGWDYQKVMQLVDELRLGDRVRFLGYVSDAYLRLLYHKAALFVFPSLFEGFGLPVLEAMACGCPVITSNCSSLPEVAGEAAVLVDPHDVDAVASAIEFVCTNHGYAQELSTRGKTRARKFSWSKSVGNIVNIYQQVCA